MMALGDSPENVLSFRLARQNNGKRGRLLFVSFSRPLSVHTLRTRMEQKLSWAKEREKVGQGRKEKKSASQCQNNSLCIHYRVSFASGSFVLPKTSWLPQNLEEERN